MSKTLLQLRNHAREYIQNQILINKMSEGKTISLSDDLIDTFINEGYQLFCSITKHITNRSTITTVSAQREYSLPTNYLAHDRIKYTTGTTAWLLGMIELNNILYYEEMSGDTVGYLIRYDNNQAQIHFYPSPARDGDTITIYGVFLPTDLSADTDSPALPSRYHLQLAQYAIFKLQMLIGIYNTEKQSAMQISAEFLKEFQAIANKCRKELEYRSENDENKIIGFDDDMLNYARPRLTLNPIVNTLWFTDSLYVKDSADGTTVFKINDDDTAALGGVNIVKNYSGTGVFNGTTGVTIPIGATLSNSTYKVFIQAQGTPDGTIGEIGITTKTTSSFKVEISGYNTATTFYWFVVE